jgi:hypothetical protein
VSKLEGIDGLLTAVFSTAVKQATTPPKAHRSCGIRPCAAMEEQQDAVAWLMGRKPRALLDPAECAEAAGYDIGFVRSRLAVFGLDAGKA